MSVFGAASMTWREARAHPSRILATIAALVLSVGFLAATQVFALTEVHAAGDRGALWASRADVVVETHLWHGVSVGPDGQPWTSRDDRDQALSDAEHELHADHRIAYYERFSMLQSQVSKGSTTTLVMLESTVSHDGLRWYSFSQGRAPRSTNEVALTSQVAGQLHARVGDEVQLDVLGNQPVRLVGLTDEQGYSTPPAYVTYATLLAADKRFPPANYREVVDAATNADRTPFSSGDGIGIVLLARATDPAAASGLAAGLERHFADIVLLHADAVTAAQVRQDVADGHLGGIRSSGLGGTGWYAWLILGCALVAVVVGMVIVATTFSVLAQVRRRQVGLFRAVGATRGQMLWRSLVDAVLLGVVAVLVSIPLGIGAAALLCQVVTHSLTFGLLVPWTRLALVAVGGVAASVVAAVGPAVAASRVLPLEALGPGPARPAHRGRARVLALVPLAAAVAGAVLLVAALKASGHTRAWTEAVAGSGFVLLACGVLAALPQVLAVVLGLVARLAGSRPLVALAALSSARNRLRTGIAAITLVVTFGLVVAVQVGTATGRRAAHDVLNQRYPADLVLQSAIAPPEATDPVHDGSGVSSPRDAQGHLVGFDRAALDRVRRTPGILVAGEFATTDPVWIITASKHFNTLPIAALTPEASRLLNHPVTLADGQVGLSAPQMTILGVHAGERVQLSPIDSDTINATVSEVDVSDSLALVTPAMMSRLGTHAKQGLILARLDPRTPAATVIEAVRGALVQRNPGLDLSGSSQQRANLDRTLDGVQNLLDAMLAIVAVVALIGVTNTLGLSVLERTREFALLRALGVSRRGVWGQLLLEAGFLAGLALVVGVAGGLATGWLVPAAVMHLLHHDPAPVQTPWRALGVAALALLVTTGAAAVIPANTASRTPPVEAMADHG